MTTPRPRPCIVPGEEAPKPATGNHPAAELPVVARSEELTTVGEGNHRVDSAVARIGSPSGVAVAASHNCTFKQLVGGDQHRAIT